MHISKDMEIHFSRELKKFLLYMFTNNAKSKLKILVSGLTKLNLPIPVDLFADWISNHLVEISS